MNCQEFLLLYSAQLDGRAEENERLVLQKHLRECAVCRRRAAEMRCLISDLRGLGELRAVGPERRLHELTVQIQSAIHGEARLQAGDARRRADLFDLWRMRLFSQGIGAIVSMVLFVTVAVGVFKPAYHALSLAEAASQVIWEDPSSDEVRYQALLKASLLQPPPPPPFSPSGELLNVSASLSEGDVIIATVKVHKDGRASINEIVAQPRDPSVISKFSSAITQCVSFQPIRRNQHTSAEAVVIFSKVNISG